MLIITSVTLYSYSYICFQHKVIYFGTNCHFIIVIIIIDTINTVIIIYFVCEIKKWNANHMVIIHGQSHSTFCLVTFGNRQNLWWARLELDANQYIIYQLAELQTEHVDGLVQVWSNRSANALELLQSCTKPPI